MALRKRGNILNLLQKVGGVPRTGGVPTEKGVVPNLEETMGLSCCGQLDCLHFNDNKKNTNENFYNLDWFQHRHE